MKDYKKLYKQTQRKMKEFIKRWDGIKLSSNDLFTEELKQIVEIESEDDRIRGAIIHFISHTPTVPKGIIGKEIMIAWLEKQKTIDVLDKEEREFADNVDSYRKEIDEFYKGYNAGKEAEKQYWLKKQGEQKHKFIIGDIISNNTVIYRVDNIVKNCIGQDCYFLVDVESEKNGTRYLSLTNSEGKTHNSGEITWLCEQVDANFEKQSKQETLCDKCKKEHPSHSCQDITELGRCAVEHKQKPADNVESMEHGYITTNSEFFQWIYDRLKYVYNENPNVDYMLSLKERIEDMQKFADKIEPKFKVGEWVVDKNGTVQQILSYKNGIYKHTNGYSSKMFEDEWRLWDITKDAKDGDVLAVNKDDVILIFRGIGNEEWNDVIDYYCRYDCYQKEFIVQKDLEFWGYIKDNQLKPATKEQRDTLMKAMTDAGWEFDFEKKELKKIHNALEECEIEHIEHGKYYYCIKDYYSGGNKRVSKGEVIQALRGMSMMALGVKANEYFIPVKCIIGDRCAWSEEDVYNSKLILSTISQDQDLSLETKDKLTSWFKIIKNRVIPQPKQEWSEKDENTIKVLMNIIRKSEMIDSIIYTDSLKEKLYDWLKFIRPKNMWISVDKEVYVKEPVLAQKIDKSDPFKGYVVCCDHTLVPNVYERYMLLSNIISQNQWKPSNEQIIALRWILNNIPYNKYKEEISGLLEQIKKL